MVVVRRLVADELRGVGLGAFAFDVGDQIAQIVMRGQDFAAVELLEVVGSGKDVDRGTGKAPSGRGSIEGIGRVQQVDQPLRSRRGALSVA